MLSDRLPIYFLSNRLDFFTYLLTEEAERSSPLTSSMIWVNILVAVDKHSGAGVARAFDFRGFSSESAFFCL